jgi:hypothetical protein
VAVATVTRDGWLFLTDTAGKPDANDQWWHFHHDERNTGLYGADTRPPATVTDLRADASLTPGAADVAWTEVGDDWWVGKPAQVDLRWSTSPITDANFSAANAVSPPAPLPSGQTERVTVSGLPVNQRVYLAERATDGAGNRSLIARTSLVTAVPANAGVSPRTGPSTGATPGGGGGLARALALRLRGRTLRFSRAGDVRVPVACLRSATSCAGSLALVASGIRAARTTTLATARFAIGGGRQALVRLHLSPRARTLVARNPALAATLVLRDARGSALQRLRVGVQLAAAARRR